MAMLETTGGANYPAVKPGDVEIAAPPKPSGALAVVLGDFEKGETWLSSKQWALRWRESQLRYEPNRELQTWEGTTVPRSSLNVYTVAQLVQSINAKVIEGIFSDNPPFSIQPRKNTSAECARAIQSLLHYQLDDCDFRREIEDGSADAILFGTSIWKANWHETHKKRWVYKRKALPNKMAPLADGQPQEELHTEESDDIVMTPVEYDHGKPVLELQDLYTTYVDPGCRRSDIRKAKWVISRVTVSAEQLNEMREWEGYDIPSEDKLMELPTVSSSTIESVNAGSHFEVIKPDDVVNEINSFTPGQCQKVIDAYDGLTYLLEPGGYTEINGTRYKDWDLYGKLLEREAALAREWHEDPDNAGQEYVPDFKYTILPAWKFKPGRAFAKRENGSYILRKEDVELLFPERLKFRELNKTYSKNPGAFACQMLNDPQQSTTDDRPFTDALIEAHTLPYTQMPLPEICQDHILWDLAGTNMDRKSEIDYSVGVVGRVDPKGRLFIIDMVRGKWNATQLATQIVLLARNYTGATMTRIEDTVGARLLEPTIQGIAKQAGIYINLDWVKIPKFLGAKRYRIDSLAQFFKADKLWLASYLPNRDALKAELLDKNPTHDDCSDAVALLVKELGMIAAIPGVDGAPTVDKKALRNKMFEAAIFGEDDTYVVDDIPERIDEPVAPPTYKAGILGYGFAP